MIILRCVELHWFFFLYLLLPTTCIICTQPYKKNVFLVIIQMLLYDIFLQVIRHDIHTQMNWHVPLYYFFIFVLPLLLLIIYSSTVVRYILNVKLHFLTAIVLSAITTVLSLSLPFWNGFVCTHCSIKIEIRNTTKVETT